MQPLELLMVFYLEHVENWDKKRKSGIPAINIVIIRKKAL